MVKPVIIVNLKHYRVSSGPESERFLLKFIPFVDSYDIRIIFALHPIDIRLAGQFPEMEFYAQHIDPVNYGPYTGQISSQVLMDLGIKGSLLNHSERRVQKDKIESTVQLAKDAGLETVLCCENYSEARDFKKLETDFVAYEPPELIGGNISVSTSNPNVIRDVVNEYSGSRSMILVGAGIKSHNDYNDSLKLGAGGVLIASGIVLSDSPLTALKSLIGIDS